MVTLDGSILTLTTDEVTFVTVLPEDFEVNPRFRQVEARYRGVFYRHLTPNEVGSLYWPLMNAVAQARLNNLAKTRIAPKHVSPHKVPRRNPWTNRYDI